MQTAMGCSYAIFSNAKIIHEVEFKVHHSCLAITTSIYMKKTGPNLHCSQESTPLQTVRLVAGMENLREIQVSGSVQHCGDEDCILLLLYLQYVSVQNRHLIDELLGNC